MKAASVQLYGTVFGPHRHSTVSRVQSRRGIDVKQAAPGARERRQIEAGTIYISERTCGAPCVLYKNKKKSTSPDSTRTSNCLGLAYSRDTPPTAHAPRRPGDGSTGPTLHSLKIKRASIWHARAAARRICTCEGLPPGAPVYFACRQVAEHTEHIHTPAYLSRVCGQHTSYETHRLARITIITHHDHRRPSLGRQTWRCRTGCLAAV